MASLGSKVLQIRSVEFAGKYKVPLRVLSSFTPWDIDIEEEASSGTLITFEEDENMEQAVVSGIAFNRDEAKISVLGVPDKPGIAYHILGAVADANIEVDVIIQNLSKDGQAPTSASPCTATTTRKTVDLLKAKVLPTLGAADIVGDTKICKVSIVGIGMRSHVGVAEQDVPRAERRGHQHPDDLDQRDQDLGRDRREVHGARRARAAQGLRSGSAGRLKLA